MEKGSYCNSYTHYLRRNSIEVSVGDTPLGGDNPVRIQTMTTTDTTDIDATVRQCSAAVNAGAEYVRITTPTLKDARALADIVRNLRSRGITTPLIADVHFNPAVALEAARHVEKVRINPGNYSDPRARFEDKTYTSEEYARELERIEERLLPLLDVCRKRNVALRIGVNHGSLSDRIMSRYGDTPEGMVESAMEFLRICRKQQFDNVVVSMKSSNTRVMVQAVRLMVIAMNAEGMAYPLHLGVTEAGDGEDGRIKSAVGIGTLLADGIGDTIRVSLTEAPEAEIPVARKLVAYFAGRTTSPPIDAIDTLPYNPVGYSRRSTLSVAGVGGDNPPAVIADLSANSVITAETLNSLGWHFEAKRKRWSRTDTAPDFLLLDNAKLDGTIVPDGLPVIVSGGEGFRLASVQSEDTGECGKPRFVRVSYGDLMVADNIERLKRLRNSILMLHTNNSNGFAEQRAFFIRLMELGVKAPVIIVRAYSDTDTESFQLKSAADLGPLLLDGMGDGVMLVSSSISNQAINATAFSILQAARTRITKTEYIACPGCGRTLFNLQETLKRVKEATAGMKGLKIGVMGCIVNGPGEMADADYGYVGAGPGLITLYRGKTVVKRNIPEDKAIDELLALIRQEYPV